MAGLTDTQLGDGHRINAPAGLGIIKVSGSDRRDFLQGQLTQDLNRLNPQTPLLAGWATPQGRLRCLCWVVDWRDSIWLILPAGLVATLSRQLAMYVLRADVQIETSGMQIFAAHCSALAAAALTEKESEENDSGHCYYKDNYLVILPANLSNVALLMGQTAPVCLPARDSGWAGWRHAAILAGMPTVWPETSGEFVPQMLNLELLDGVSFRKGCYVGQEIVARTQNLGRIKRRMFRFRTSGACQLVPGSPLYSEASKVGQVVDAVCNAEHTDFLAVISLDKLQQPLAADSAGRMTAERMSLPYPIPELQH